MDKTKPFEIIAARFKISKESAKYFLGHVQKSFKTARPPQALIVEFMAGRKFKSIPEPYEVAKTMNESGVWVEAMNTEPARLVDEEDIYFK